MLKIEMEEKIVDLESRLSRNRQLAAIAERDRSAALRKLVDHQELEAKVEHAKWALEAILSLLRHSHPTDLGRHNLGSIEYGGDGMEQIEGIRRAMEENQNKLGAISVAYAGVRRLSEGD